MLTEQYTSIHEPVYIKPMPIDGISEFSLRNYKCHAYRGFMQYSLLI